MHALNNYRSIHLTGILSTDVETLISQTLGPYLQLLHSETRNRSSGRDPVPEISWLFVMSTDYVTYVEEARLELLIPLTSQELLMNSAGHSSRIRCHVLICLVFSESSQSIPKRWFKKDLLSSDYGIHDHEFLQHAFSRHWSWIYSVQFVFCWCYGQTSPQMTGI